jgi:torulene dioxygenase
MDPCQMIVHKIFTAFQAMHAMDASSPSPSGINASMTLMPDMPGLDVETLGFSTPSGTRYIVAKTDANMLQVIDPKTLKPLIATTYEQLDPRLGGLLSAAHSCRDQETGDFYNSSCKFGGQFPRTRYLLERAIADAWQMRVPASVGVLQVGTEIIIL